MASVWPKKDDNGRKRRGVWIGGYIDENGKRRQRTIPAATKKEAERIVSEFERDAYMRRNGLHVAPTGSRQSFAEVAEWWLENC